MILDKIVGLLGGGVAEFFKERQRLKNELKLKRLEGQIKIEEAKASRIAKAMENDQEWELAHIQNSGWKDEYVLVLVSIPLVLVFIPPLAQYVLSGFEILDQTPIWYQVLITSVFFAIYGIRYFKRKINGTSQ